MGHISLRPNASSLWIFVAFGMIQRIHTIKLYIQSGVEIHRSLFFSPLPVSDALFPRQIMMFSIWSAIIVSGNWIGDPIAVSNPM